MSKVLNAATAEPWTRPETSGTRQMQKRLIGCRIGNRRAALGNKHSGGGSFDSVAGGEVLLQPVTCGRMKRNKTTLLEFGGPNEQSVFGNIRELELQSLRNTEAGSRDQRQ